MKYTLLVVCVLAIHTLYAQDTYKGKVLNTYNQSIENAKISVNDSVVAVTDKFGMFNITLTEPNVAYVYAEGYEVFEAELTDNTQFYTFNIQPEGDLNELIVNPCLDGNEQTGRKAWWRNAVAGVNREGAIAWWALPRDRLVSRR